MCDTVHESRNQETKAIPVDQAVGTVLAHDITEIRPGEFKGRAFKKGHVVRQEDVGHLQRLGKENLFVLNIGDDEMHENDAAFALARALMGSGVGIKGEPKEGKIDLVAEVDGIVKIRKDALFSLNMLGDVMCATVHDNTVVKKGQQVAGTRAIPLVVKKRIVEEAVNIGRSVQDTGIVSVRAIRKPKAGVVITGNEVYHGRIKDAFAPVIMKKIEDVGGEIAGLYYAPDDKRFIIERLRELLKAGADILITTGGMSVDPDDVTRFAIRELGAEITYGSSVLPGAMFLIGYLERDGNSIPVIGIPACGMYSRTTVFDLILPRVLAGERIGRKEIAELGHGGLCLQCPECRHPVCPFGK